MLSRFVEDGSGRTIYLSEDKGYILKNGVVTEISRSILPYLSHDVYLDENYTLGDLFSLLAREENVAFAEEALSGFLAKEYIALWRITKPRESEVLFRIIVSIHNSFSKGETYTDKELRARLTNEAPSPLPRTKVVFADREMEDMFTEMSKEYNAEILGKIRDGSYDNYMKTKQHVSRSIGVSAAGKKDDTFPSDKPYTSYSIEETPLAELLGLPIRFGEYHLENEDVDYENPDRILVFENKPDIHLYDFLVAIFDELSWSSPGDRSDEDSTLHSL